LANSQPERKKFIFKDHGAVPLRDFSGTALLFFDIEIISTANPVLSQIKEEDIFHPENDKKNLKKNIIKLRIASSDRK
jgi:hypothetical protein